MIVRTPVSKYPKLVRELTEVRETAEALWTAIAASNYVPEGFPNTELQDISETLAQLGDGSIGVARTSLEYARVILPKYRNTYFGHDSDLSGDSGDFDLPKVFQRKGLVDQELVNLIA